MALNHTSRLQARVHILSRELENLKLLLFNRPQPKGLFKRNRLRAAGFGEEALGVPNLDDVYVPILEAAAGYRNVYHLFQEAGAG